MRKYGGEECTLDDLNEEDKLMYGEATIFHGDEEQSTNVRYEVKDEPVIVGMENEEIKISEDEAAVLALGPKFCVVKNLSEEVFERELEEAVMKFKWEMMGKDLKLKKDEVRDPADISFDVMKDELFTEDEVREIEEYNDEQERMRDAEMRMIYNPENNTMDLSRRRATDLKGNSHVIFPRRVSNFEIEAKLETFRTEVKVN